MLCVLTAFFVLCPYSLPWMVPPWEKRHNNHHMLPPCISCHIQSDMISRIVYFLHFFQIKMHLFWLKRKRRFEYIISLQTYTYSLSNTRVYKIMQKWSELAPTTTQIPELTPRVLWFSIQVYCNAKWPQDWKRSVFIPMPKKGNAKQCSNYRTIALISHASKVMLKILQPRLQQYVNHELPDAQAGFRKGRGTRDQIANVHWIIEKSRAF